MPLLPLIIIGLIIFSVNNDRKNQKRKAEQQRQKRAAQAQNFPPAAGQNAAEGSYPAYEQMEFDPPPAPAQTDPRFPDLSTPPRTRSAPAPAVKTRTQQTVHSRMEDPTGRNHVLEAASITGHAHTESSMSGFAPSCPPTLRRTASPANKQTNPTAPMRIGQVSLDFAPESVVSGFLYSEILDKPKALRRR